MSTALETSGGKALTLWESETRLLELADIESGEELTPEQEAELQGEIAESLQYALDKRESYGLFLMFLDQQVANAKREVNRLRQRVDRMENLSARLRKYGVGAIRSLGTDHRGKFRRLVGHTVTLFIRALPSSVDIRDEVAVPAEFKRVTIQLPATVYERLASTVAPILAEAPIKEVYIDREAVKKAIESGREVPGADLKLSGWDHTLVVK